MFLIDDFLLSIFGMSLKPFDMIWILELLGNYALKEKYDTKKIGNRVKENQLLFEIGEITAEEYGKENQLLLEELKRAEEIMASLSKDIQIQEI